MQKTTIPKIVAIIRKTPKIRPPPVSIFAFNPEVNKTASIARPGIR